MTLACRRFWKNECFVNNINFHGLSCIFRASTSAGKKKRPALTIAIMSQTLLRRRKKIAHHAKSQATNYNARPKCNLGTRTYGVIEGAYSKSHRLAGV